LILQGTNFSKIFTFFTCYLSLTWYCQCVDIILGQVMFISTNDPYFYKTISFRIFLACILWRNQSIRMPIFCRLF
jgi:hypothetical protein